jgi:hypothetical protein
MLDTRISNGQWLTEAKTVTEYRGRPTSLQNLPRTAASAMPRKRLSTLFLDPVGSARTAIAESGQIQMNVQEPKR